MRNPKDPHRLHATRAPNPDTGLQLFLSCTYTKALTWENGQKFVHARSGGPDAVLLAPQYTATTGPWPEETDHPHGANRPYRGRAWAAVLMDRAVGGPGAPSLLVGRVDDQLGGHGPRFFPAAPLRVRKADTRTIREGWASRRSRVACPRLTRRSGLPDGWLPQRAGKPGPVAVEAAPSSGCVVGADGAGGVLEEPGETDGVGRVQRDLLPLAERDLQRDMLRPDDDLTGRRTCGHAHQPLGHDVR